MQGGKDYVQQLDEELEELYSDYLARTQRRAAHVIKEMEDGGDVAQNCPSLLPRELQSPARQWQSTTTHKNTWLRPWVFPLALPPLHPSYSGIP